MLSVQMTEILKHFHRQTYQWLLSGPYKLKLLITTLIKSNKKPALVNSLILPFKMEVD